MSELQDLVDALASELERPVDVDDRRFRILAYSSHVGQVDSVRVASILQRQAPVEITRWLESLGIEDADDHMRVPANQAFGMAARLCMPLRFQGTLLGYLWLIDEPAPLTDEELATARRYASEVAVVLYRLRLQESGDRAHEHQLVQRLLEADAAGREEAAQQLLALGFLASATSYTLIALQAVHPLERQPPDAVRVQLAAAMEQLRRSVALHHLLSIVIGDHVVGMLACDAPGEPERRAHKLLELAERSLAPAGWQALVGVGDPVASVADAQRSKREALCALRVATSVRELGPVTLWNTLGPYRTIARLLDVTDPRAALPESLRRLLAAPDGRMLTSTLETYLDAAGDAQATAAALFIHRSSVYHRLHRIEQLAGVALRDGNARLELHLGLKLWRLGGDAQEPTGADAGASARPLAGSLTPPADASRASTRSRATR